MYETPEPEGEMGERLSPLDGQQLVYKLDAEYLHWAGNDYAGKQEADIQAGRINNLFRKLPRSAMADYVDCSIMWTVRCGMAWEPCVIWVFGD